MTLSATFETTWGFWLLRDAVWDDVGLWFDVHSWRDRGDVWVTSA